MYLFIFKNTCLKVPKIQRLELFCMKSKKTQASSQVLHLFFIFLSMYLHNLTTVLLEITGKSAFNSISLSNVLLPCFKVRFKHSTLIAMWQ